MNSSNDGKSPLEELRALALSKDGYLIDGFYTSQSGSRHGTMLALEEQLRGPIAPRKRTLRSEFLTEKSREKGTVHDGRG
jgi:hypothetical protein